MYPYQNIQKGGGEEEKLSSVLIVLIINMTGITPIFLDQYVYRILDFVVLSTLNLAFFFLYSVMSAGDLREIRRKHAKLHCENHNIIR